MKKSTIMTMVCVIFVLGCFIAVFCKMYEDRQRFNNEELLLNAELYVETKSPTNNNLQTRDKNKIKSIIEWLNNTNCSKISKGAMTTKSPIIMIHFMKADGSYDSISIWEDAQTPNMYIYDNSIQYKIEDIDDFFRRFEELAITVQLE